MVTATADGVLIEVRVAPRAGRAGIAGVRGDAVLVRLNSAPVDGAANEELIQILSRALRVPKRAVAIVTGERSRRKRLAVSGITIEDVERATR